MSDMLDNLLGLLVQGQDNPMLRFSLGDLYLKRDEPEAAVTHLAEAVRQDPRYSAAWKLYGRALAGAGHKAQAERTFEYGIEVAEGRGDKQAAKEMRVFLKRLQKA
jgi:predicted Zn-dependent protease